MRLAQAMIVASKDFATFTKKRNIIYSIIVLPFAVSILFPLVVRYVEQKGAQSVASLTYLLPSFSFFFLILAGIIPTTLASYSIVGEKTEKSLEPLLATPTTDSEILLGKGIASVLPPLATILAASGIFMALIDAVTSDKLGYYYFPNWSSAVVLFLMVPLATVMSVEWSVLVSSRVSDLRVAQQVGTLIVLPFAGLYVGGELNLIQLGDTSTLLELSAVIALMDVAFLYVARSAFNRDEILTKWK